MSIKSLGNITSNSKISSVSLKQADNMIHDISDKFNTITEEFDLDNIFNVSTKVDVSKTKSFFDKKVNNVKSKVIHGVGCIIDNTNKKVVSRRSIPHEAATSKFDIKKDPKYPVVQGCCETEKYIIVSCREDYDSRKARIIVYDKNGNKVNEIPGLPFDHTNGMAYDSKRGVIYVAYNSSYDEDRESLIAEVPVDELISKRKGKDVKFKMRRFESSDGISINVSGITYDEKNDRIIIATGNTVRFISPDGSCKKIKKIDKTYGKNEGENQDIFYANDKLFVIRTYKEGSDKNNGVDPKKGDICSNVIDIYDKDGNYIESVPVHFGETKGYKFELESISYDKKANSYTLYYNNYIRGGSQSVGEKNGRVYRIPGKYLN